MTCFCTTKHKRYGSVLSQNILACPMFTALLHIIKHTEDMSRLHQKVLISLFFTALFWGHTFMHPWRLLLLMPMKQYTSNMRSALCNMGIALCSVRSLLCSIGIAPCSVRSLLCSIGIVLFSVRSSLCIIGIALCSVRSSLCSIGIALFSVRSSLCIELNWITLFKVSYVIVKLHNSSHLLKVCLTNANWSIIIMTIISNIKQRKTDL